MTTNTYQPDSSTGKDTYLNEAAATTNYGTATTMIIGAIVAKAASRYNSLISFDISNIPSGSTISAAKLTFNCTSVDFGGGFTDGTASRLIRSDWDPATATFNIYKTANNWTAGGAASNGNDYSSTNQVTWTAPAAAGAFDITGLGVLAQDAIDNRSGILILKLWRITAAASSDIFVSTSDDGTAGNRPKLTVDFTSPSTTRLLALLDCGT